METVERGVKEPPVFSLLNQISRNHSTMENNSGRCLKTSVNPPLCKASKFEVGRRPSHLSYCKHSIFTYFSLSPVVVILCGTLQFLSTSGPIRKLLCTILRIQPLSKHMWPLGQLWSPGGQNFGQAFKGSGTSSEGN